MKKNSIFIMTMAMVIFVAANCFPAGLKGDFDNDGDVDGDDLKVFSNNFGKSECVCSNHDNCVPGHYCAKEEGDCEGVGRCSPKPEACLDVWIPICGCDGNTYSNSCYAAAAGVNVMYKGECQEPGHFNLGEVFLLRYQETKYNDVENLNIKLEGVLSDSRCPADVQCVWQGNAEIEFTFSKNDVPRSFILNTGIEPSEVSLFGYNIKLERLDPPVLLANPPEQEDYIAHLLITKSDSSCFDNEGCRADSYCAKESGDCNGSGKCTPRPEICTANWDPVCGCDSVTYSNACAANRFGVNIAHLGRCEAGKCDDGSEWICDMVPPICSEFEILALQNGCWICANPATCLPWGEPGCSIDPSGASECPEGFYCDPCGTSSCPFCDDCVPACVADER